jgi:hypothetical protein
VQQDEIDVQALQVRRSKAVTRLPEACLYVLFSRLQQTEWPASCIHPAAVLFNECLVFTCMHV